MGKRLFQVLDEMNVNDEVNKTATLPCSFTMVAANSDKRGGLVTMGVEAHILQKIFLGEMQPVLVVMDTKEYHRLEAIPLDNKLQVAEARAERYENALQLISQMSDPGDYWKAICDMKAVASDALTPKTSTDGSANG